MKDVYKRQGEVIYGCDESTIRSVAKKYSEQLGSHYFMLTNVGEDYIYSHSFLVKLIGFISSLCAVSYTHLDVYKRQAYKQGH